jgi:hypothetical protein
MVRILTFASLLVVLLGGSLVSAKSFSEKSAEEPKSVEVEEAEELLELIDPGLAEADVRDEIDDTDPDENLPDEVETDSRNLRNSLVKIGKVGEKKLKQFFGRGENDEEVETDWRVEEIPTEDRELALARAGPKKRIKVKGKERKGKQRPNGGRNGAYKEKEKQKKKKGNKPRKPKKVKDGLQEIKKLTMKIIGLLLQHEVTPEMLKGFPKEFDESYEIDKNIAGGKLKSKGDVQFTRNGRKSFKVATDSFSSYHVGKSSPEESESLLDLFKP